MSLTYVGAISLPVLVPSVYASIGAASVMINAAFQGNLSVHASFSASPPTLPGILAGLTAFEVSLVEAISLGLPSVSFDVSAAASLVASLNLAFDLLIILDALLAANIGIYAYSYTGIANAMGAALTTALASTWPDGAPTNTATNAFIFGAVTPGANEALGEFLDGLGFGAGLQYAGRFGLSTLSGITLRAATQGEAGIKSQLDGALALQASLAVQPPTLVADHAATAKFAAFLGLQGELALPSVQFALDATAKAAASLSAKFGLLIQLGATLSKLSALFIYRYSGLGNAMGADVTTALAPFWGDGTTPTNTPCNAAILGATDTLTFTTMSAFFGGA